PGIRFFPRPKLFCFPLSIFTTSSGVSTSFPTVSIGGSPGDDDCGRTFWTEEGTALRLRAGPDVISVPSVALTARRNARNQAGLIFQSGGNEFSIGLRATAIVSDRW